MKKTSMMTLVSYFVTQNGLPSDVADAVDELKAELNRNAVKAAANRELYEAARGVVLDQLATATEGATLAELVESCSDNLPEGFTKGKVQYALLHYWNDAVSVEQTKNGNVYRLR